MRLGLDVLVSTDDSGLVNRRHASHLSLLNSALNRLQVANASILLRFLAVAHEVRDRDSGQDAMMATTIMISTRVKPFIIFFMVCSFCFCFSMTGTLPII